MRRFWIHLKLYIHHLRRGIIPAGWPPRLIELPRGKRYLPDPRVDQLWDGHDFSYKKGVCRQCGLDYWEWFEAPDEIECD